MRESVLIGSGWLRRKQCGGSGRERKIQGDNEDGIQGTRWLKNQII